MIQILERRNLSPKSMIYLLEIDGQRLVVGDSQASGLCFFGALGAEMELPDGSAFAKIMQHEVKSPPFSVEKPNANNRAVDTSNATDELRPAGVP